MGGMTSISLAAKHHVHLRTKAVQQRSDVGLGMCLETDPLTQQSPLLVGQYPGKGEGRPPHTPPRSSTGLPCWLPHTEWTPTTTSGSQGRNVAVWKALFLGLPPCLSWSSFLLPRGIVWLGLFSYFLLGTKREEEKGILKRIITFHSQNVIQCFISLI